MDPYPSKGRRSHYSSPILTRYEEHEGKPVTVAGRLIWWRKQGGMAFGHIQDQTGSILLVLRRQTLAPLDPTNTLGRPRLFSRKSPPPLS